MSSSSAIDREYAYFQAIGFFEPADITRLLEIEPSESWLAGEEFILRGHTRNRQTSCWMLRSGLNDTEPLARHVDALLRELTPRRAGMIEASTKAKLWVVCVGYYEQSFGWELGVEQMRLASALNAGFLFDTYSFGDLHEEIVALRKQLGVRAKF